MRDEGCGECRGLPSAKAPAATACPRVRLSDPDGVSRFAPYASFFRFSGQRVSRGSGSNGDTGRRIEVSSERDRLVRRFEDRSVRRTGGLARDIWRFTVLRVDALLHFVVGRILAASGKTVPPLEAGPAERPLPERLVGGRGLGSRSLRVEALGVVIV